MILALGQFVFGTDTLTFNNLQRSRTYALAKNDTAQARPQYQFTGISEETVNIPFMVYEEHGFGKQSAIDELYDMADSGAGFVLVDGTGYIYGVFAVAGIDETKTHLMIDGFAKKVDGTIKLVRVDDGRISTDKAPNTTPQE